MKKHISTLLISLMATGCSTTLPINYIPSPPIKGQGNVNLGEFTYTPATDGKVKENQFQKATGAIGEIYTGNKVSDLIKLALKKELIASGYTITDTKDIKIEGSVDQFLYDWRGFVEVDFYLTINFKIMKNDSILLSLKTQSHQAAPKTMVQDTEAIRAAISDCIDQLLTQAKGKSII